MKARRPYDSALRQTQVAQTRERILDAVSALMAVGAARDVTVPRVAERAGVTVRTVYRYFPTRAALIDAMQAWALAKMGAPAWPRDTRALVAFAVPLFERFDQNRDVVEAQLRGGAMAEVRSEGKARRVQALRQTLLAELEGLPDGAQRAALGVIKHLLSASAWQALREDVGMDGTGAGRAVAWAIEALVRDLKQQRAATQRAGGNDGPGSDRLDGTGERRRRGAAVRPRRGPRDGGAAKR